MFKDRPLNAGLYNLRTIDFSYFIKPKELEKADRIMELCLKALEAVIAEIISPNADFYPDTSDDYTCKRCVFSSLCK
jgi:hypothetical protein